MLHPQLGENPEWALIRARERLEFTDPRCTPPPHRWTHLSSVRMAFGIAAAAAIIAIVPGDSTGADTVPTATHLAWHPDGQLQAGLGSADSDRQHVIQPNPAHRSINHGSHREGTM